MDGKRIVGLDALRGLAALGVALYHYTDLYFAHAYFLAPVFVWARYGVNLFFMISGFVIYMTLEKVDRPLDFFMSRFTRLFPAYWAAIALTFCATRWAGPPNLQVDTETALVNLSMLQGYLHFSHVDLSYWTLGIELTFYSLLFVLIWFRKLDRINPVLIGLLILALLDKTLGGRFPVQAFHLGFPQNELFLYYIQYFAAGIAIYRLGAKRDFRRPTNYVVLALALILIKQNLPWASTWLHLGFAGLIYLVAAGFTGPLGWKPLVLLGLISYPFYLIHQYFGYVVLDALRAHGLGAGASISLTLAVCLFLSALIYRGLEKPVRKAILSRYRLAIRKPIPA